MKQSLPDIVAVCRVDCSALIPNITERFRAHLPVSVSQPLSAIELCGKGSCEAEQEYDNGGYSEKTVLQFTTTEELSHNPPQAFVIMDAEGQSYIIGTREAPYPMVETTRTIDKDMNVSSVKVTFTRPKSLVPCVI